MKILAIHWGTNSTAALMCDGEVIACVSEERFSRKKNDESYPLHAIEAVLAIGRIAPKELDVVACSGERFDPIGIITHKWSNSSVQDRLKEQQQYWYPRLYQKKEPFYLDIFKDKIDTQQYPGDWDEVMDFIRKGDERFANQFYQEFRRNTVSRHLGIDPKKIIFTHHHRAHAYYAYYASPMPKDKTLIFTADAWGDDMNASVSLAEGSKITVLSTSQNFMIGRVYRYITLLLGMKPDEHEYKIMGLAAYAKPKYYKDPLTVFEKTMFVDGLGFKYHELPADLYFYFRDRLEGYRFDSIAGAIQRYTDDILVQWVSNAVKTTSVGKVCFGGGVGMNIKSMMEIAKLPEIEEIFICPTPSDESLAIGAAYVVSHDTCISQGQDPIRYLKPLESAYLGPQNGREDVAHIAEIAKKKGYMVQENPSPRHIAKLIDEGKIIGRCAGRSEFGARALGSRSIITDPRELEVVKVINEKVKSRDFWMPFAPSLLEEKSDTYLENPKGLKAPYMTIGFETKLPAVQDLKAALHQHDLTARPQLVTEKANVEYYSILNEFFALTGVGGVLNTSFNIHGEPIVQTALEAFEVFERTELDVLLLDNYLIQQADAA